MNQGRRLRRFSTAWETLLMALLVMAGCGRSPAASIQPSPTLSPTPIPGFAEFRTDEMTIQLPETFAGGDFNVILNEMDDVSALGATYTALVDSAKDLIDENPDLIELFAVNLEDNGSGILTNVNVTHEPIPPGTTIEEYLDASLEMLSSFQGATILTQNILSDHEAVLEIKVDVPPLPAMRQLIHMHINDGTGWVVTFTVAESEYREARPQFEQSIDSLILHAK